METTTVVRGVWQLEVEVATGSFCSVYTDRSLGHYSPDSALCLSDPLEAATCPFVPLTDKGENMRYFLSFAAMLGIAISVAVAADVPPVPVEGRILQLNKPGAIAIEISVGSGDGLKAGDVLVVSRKNKPIGKVKLAKVEADRSTATITEVQAGEVIERGDRVIR